LQHRFEIAPEGKVFYRSRRTCDEYVEYIQENREPQITFGQPSDICESLFHKFMTAFKPGPPIPDSKRNVNVTLTTNFPVGAKLTDHQDKLGLRNLFVKTDGNLLRSLDPVTLDPLKSMNYGDLVPEAHGTTTASHAAMDPDTGELFNFVLNFGTNPTYTLFKLTPPTKDSGAGYKVLTKITDAPAAYIHSVCLTKKYFVFCVWQADYKLNGVTIPFYKNMVQSFEAWDPKRQTLWYVIDRETGALIRKFESDPFFAFHYIASYDERDDIIIEIATFETHEVIHSLYLDAIKSSTATKPLTPNAYLTRIRLENITSSDSVSTTTTTRTDLVIELPTISASYVTHRARYTYGVSTRGLSALWDSVVKIDLSTDTLLHRYERPKCTPSEPIFVPRPGAKGEDDGAVLIVELDGVKGTSALVALDAGTFEVLARAEGEFVVPHGFHGTWWAQ
jgi:torulene dioxygenase